MTRRRRASAMATSGSIIGPRCATRLMNAHADLFAQIPAIARMLADQIDQMKLFELIQIIPTPTRAALASGNFAAYRISDPTDHGILAQQQHLHFRQGGPGKNLGDLSRNPRCDVAVQRQVQARTGQIRGAQSSGKGRVQ